MQERKLREFGENKEESMIAQQKSTRLEDVHSQLQEALSMIPAHTRSHSKDPTIHFRIYLTNSNRSWYVVGGEEADGDLIFFGYELSAHYADSYPAKGESFTYSFLKKAAEIVGESIKVDQHFTARKLSAVAAEIE
ncbi:MAG: hypothetical protein IPM63_11645 [Acidobacteriota bacterium]|nr:MAG: hypothetical protein IPM63_11645 [Acidobacteriota bacterium]